MIVISKKQLALFAQVQADNFKKSMLELFRDKFSERYQQLGEVQAAQFVDEALAQAQNKHLSEQQSITKYMTLIFVYGKNLQDNPNLHQSELLKPSVLTDQVVDQVYAAAVND